MIDYLDIAHLIEMKPAQIMFVGDSTQIGNIEMNKTAGRRHELNLFDFVST